MQTCRCRRRSPNAWLVVGVRRDQAVTAQHALAYLKDGFAFTRITAIGLRESD